MEIHRFEKLWTAAALLLIVGLIATVTYGTVGAGVKMVDDSGGTVDAGSLGDTEFGDPGVTQVGENQYEVHVVARQFLFQPGTTSPIRVPANSEVTFYITSADVVHGFEVAGTNINVMVIPGQVAEITVRFDDPGQYGIVCHEYCGAGHHTMAGQLVVVPEDEYEGGS
ncbi:cytochrome c oxidase subunit II [Haloplanus aerogenes]|uniref:Cytochrome C oxidase subunit II n=1 Tax=Haloplanus aerogenes TaxID=660522 RepID=A0A3M0DU10_9EURY|nr:cytochrome c oxidase subunit II [Haloplanus aerogenes]AZH24214.1 cytochrome C oxidase subunit II [Haloplanus aerogenes]RMB24160.1 cytochrome c oxidase subunit 2 [Haloplanus aerogenes]